MKSDLNPVNVHIGRRIRARRLALRLSQEKLGTAVGVSFQQIQKYERGANRCAGECLVNIATTLGVSPGWFYEGAPGLAESPTNPETQEIASFMALPEGTVLARAFVRIPDLNVRRAIAKFVTDMAVRQQAAE